MNVRRGAWITVCLEVATAVGVLMVVSGAKGDDFPHVFAAVVGVVLAGGGVGTLMALLFDPRCGRDVEK